MNIFRKQPLDTVTTFYNVKPTHLQAHLLFFPTLGPTQKKSKEPTSQPTTTDIAKGQTTTDEEQRRHNTGDRCTTL
jgi:hypothetical protein